MKAHLVSEVTSSAMAAKPKAFKFEEEFLWAQAVKAGYPANERQIWKDQFDWLDAPANDNDI